MPKCLSGSAVLRGLSNGHWTVKLSLEAYCLFITEGWDRFFEENALRKNDFLVFGYCGGGETEKFDVRIFDKHGRERLDVPDAVGLSATNQEIKKEDTNVAFGRKEKGCKYSENNTLSGLQGENLSIGLKPETSCKRKRDGPAESGVATMSLDRNDTTEVAMSAWSKSLAFSSSNPFFKCILTKQHLQKYHLSIPQEMTYVGFLPAEKTKIVRNLKVEVWVVGVAPNTGGCGRKCLHI